MNTAVVITKREGKTFVTVHEGRRKSTTEVPASTKEIVEWARSRYGSRLASLVEYRGSVRKELAL